MHFVEGGFGLDGLKNLLDDAGMHLLVPQVVAMAVGALAHVVLLKAIGGLGSCRSLVAKGGATLSQFASALRVGLEVRVRRRWRVRVLVLAKFTLEIINLNERIVKFIDKLVL